MTLLDVLKPEAFKFFAELAGRDHHPQITRHPWDSTRRSPKRNGIGDRDEIIYQYPITPKRDYDCLSLAGPSVAGAKPKLCGCHRFHHYFSRTSAQSSQASLSDAIRPRKYMITRRRRRDFRATQYSWSWSLEFDILTKQRHEPRIDEPVKCNPIFPRLWGHHGDDRQPWRAHPRNSGSTYHRF